MRFFYNFRLLNACSYIAGGDIILIRILSALVLVLHSNPAFGFNPSCEALFRSRDSNGSISDFVRFFEPVFNLSDLETKRATLGWRNEHFLIANSSLGGVAWYAEARVIRGENRITATKYSRQVYYDAQSLMQMHGVFSRLNLLRYFDVLKPLRYRPQQGSALFPYLEARSLASLTARANFDDGLIPLQDLEKGRDGGPPGSLRYPELAHLWTVQQERIEIVSDALKEHGFRVEKFYRTAVSGSPYLWMVVVRSPDRAGHFGFSIRSDLLVTTDGRFVIGDPE